MKGISIGWAFFFWGALTTHLTAQNVWQPDLGNGYYKNPVLYADYSDPDVIRVGADFYMVASGFNVMPGIPVLHSNDLVNWQIIGHVYNKLPFEKYDKPAHGEGSWAPSIRYRNGKFYVYFCTPKDGLFMATATDPAGSWELHWVQKVELWEDPCPFWDEDGNAYLIRSKLRADELYLHKMSADGTKLLDNGMLIYKNLENNPVIEGPKLFKKDGYYYILAPAGGVGEGWQTALRSKNLYGPYESKVVLHTGNTAINGPHQGGLVELPSGEWWFMHFQDKGAYGRVVHLQPVHWVDGWPEMGVDTNNDGIGEPVSVYKKPNVRKVYPAAVPQTSDEFDGDGLGLQWQWHGNPATLWYSLSAATGALRLYAVNNPTQQGNLWFVPNLLLQKFMAPSFKATTKVYPHTQLIGEKCGLVIMGETWAYIALNRTALGYELGMYTGSYYEGYDKTEQRALVPLNTAECYMRVTVGENLMCRFQYSTDGNTYTNLGVPFQAQKGRWIGAKVGLFCLNPNITESKGYADFEWFRVSE